MKNLSIFFLSLMALLVFGQCSQAQKLERRPFFGARMANITDAQQKSLKLPNTDGVHLDRVVPKSSAAVSNFQQGDVLVAINGQPIKGVPQFLPVLRSYKTGDQVKMTYYRHGKKATQTLTFQEFPKIQSDQYDMIYGSVKAKNNVLRTIIAKPKGQGRFPAVVIVQGVGCVTIDVPQSAYYETMYQHFTSKGIAVMQIEKTGMGDSKGTPCRECTFEEEVEGYKQGLLALKKMPFVDANQTFMFGFSMGGVIAPIVASEVPVKGIIAYGTVSRNWIEYSMENSRRQAEMAGTAYDQIARNMKNKGKALHYMMVEKLPKKEVLTKYPEIANYINFYPQSYRYFQSVGNLNLAEYWLKTDAFVYAIHGKADFVSFKRDHALIAKIINRKSPGTATHLELPNSDHWMRNVNTMAESLERLRSNPPINYQLFTEVTQWIADKVKQKKALTSKD